MAPGELERKVDLTFLADFYGALLTENQQRILSLYCGEDLSLAEIAEETGISRQAVHESLTRASAKLYEMEAALGVASRFRRMEAGLKEALSALHKGEYDRAGRLLEALQALDQEENHGL